MLSSSFWIGMIAAGAVLVAISNIQYNRVREFENKQSKANQVRELLRPEIQRNVHILAQMRVALNAQSVRIETFDTTAWQTVSGSDLLFGLPNNELSALMQAYRLMNRANTLHAKILDSSIGMASALSGSEKTRGLFMNDLASALQQLEPLMNSLLGK